MGLDSWLNIRLQTLGTFICLMINIYLVVSKGRIESGLAILLFYNIIALPGTINYFIQMTTVIETSMVAVERAH